MHNKVSGNLSKYCRYHQSLGHDTNNFYQLKNVIEDLIQNGRLSRFVKTKYNDDNHKRYRKRRESPRNPRNTKIGTEEGKIMNNER